MQKLKLSLDDLRVTTFQAADAAAPGRSGTVKGHGNQPAQTSPMYACGGPFTEWLSCGYTACNDQGCSNMRTWCADCTDRGSV